MRVRETALPGVLLLEGRRHGDDRGWFAEMWSERDFREAGLPTRFVQDNQSLSRRGVLRGLHFQIDRPQGKLIRVVRGAIWDVAVDVRQGSPNFGVWAGFHLQPVTEAGDPMMLWIPEGFAHGFLVLSDEAEVLYKVTDVYSPEGERTILWDDAELGIPWPLERLAGTAVQVSEKDARGRALREAELPRMAPAASEAGG